MNSAKNTVVAILLLGVSYGVYQVINAPDTGDPLVGLMKLVEPSADASPMAATETPKSGVADDWNASFTAPTPPELPPLPEQPAARPAAQPPAQNVASSSMANSPPAGPPAGIAGFHSPGPAPTNQSPANPAPSNPPSSSVAMPGDGIANLAPIKPRDNGPPTRFGAPGSEAQPPASSATINPPASNSYAGTALVPSPLGEAWPAVEQMAGAGNFRGALEKLSPYYERTSAGSPDREQLTSWLDALAAKVIYSTEHRFDAAPYIVQPGDSLDSLAVSWQIPAQLIYNVNRQRIPNPSQLTPGIELKKIAGPFRASVSRSDGELTLYVNELYAGRFRLAGDVSSLAGGTCRITRKQSSGSPCGQFCLETSQPGLALHAAGTGSPPSGTISFQTADAEDLFGILSEGSEITVR